MTSPQIASGLVGRQIGLAADLIACCQVDRFDFLAELRDAATGDEHDRPAIVRLNAPGSPDPPASIT